MNLSEVLAEVENGKGAVYAEAVSRDDCCTYSVQYHNDARQPCATLYFSKNGHAVTELPVGLRWRVRVVGAVNDGPV